MCVLQNLLHDLQIIDHYFVKWIKNKMNDMHVYCQIIVTKVCFVSKLGQR